MKTIEGILDGKGKKFGIVASRFNSFIVDRLIEGAVDGLKRHGVEEDDIILARCPGSFEIPGVAKKMARSGKVDAVIGIGSLIRGATTHYDHVAAEVTKGLATLSFEGDIPVIYGIVTAESIEQAIERAGTKAGNRGFAAAESALEMVNLYGNLSSL